MTGKRVEKEVTSSTNATTPLRSEGDLKPVTYGECIRSFSPEDNVLILTNGSEFCGNVARLFHEFLQTGTTGGLTVENIRQLLPTVNINNAVYTHIHKVREVAESVGFKVIRDLIPNVSHRSKEPRVRYHIEQVSPLPENTQSSQSRRRKTPNKISPDANNGVGITDFEAIAESFRGPLLRFTRSLGVIDGEDVVQDVLLKAYHALLNKTVVVPPGNVSAWLYRITANTVYDGMRRSKLIQWYSLDNLDHEPEDVEGADPQEIYGTTELVRAALHRMPQQYRAALLLDFQEGFSVSEIAQALNIAESGVRMYLSRARQSFREHYRALEQGGGTK